MIVPPFFFIALVATIPRITRKRTRTLLFYSNRRAMRCDAPCICRDVDELCFPTTTVFFVAGVASGFARFFSLRVSLLRLEDIGTGCCRLECCSYGCDSWVPFGVFEAVLHTAVSSFVHTDSSYYGVFRCVAAF